MCVCSKVETERYGFVRYNSKLAQCPDGTDLLIANNVNGSNIQTCS